MTRGNSLCRSVSEGGQVGVEVGYGFYAAEIVFQGQVLVGGVGVFVGETKTDQDAGDFEGIVHLGDEGNGAALANEDRPFAEAFF